MESDNAFKPGGNTSVIASAASPPTAIQLGGPGAGDMTVMFFNSGTVTVFIAWGPSAAAAATNAAIPIAGTPSGTLPVPAGTVETFTMPANQYYTGISSQACTVYATPGNGI